MREISVYVYEELETAELVRSPIRSSDATHHIRDVAAVNQKENGGVFVQRHSVAQTLHLHVEDVEDRVCMYVCM